jgi:hypothetical protein
MRVTMLNEAAMKHAPSLCEVLGAEAAEWGGVKNWAEQKELVGSARFLPIAAEKDCGHSGDADQCENQVRPDHVAGDYDRRQH